jgi:hypothetical protein
MVDRKHWELNIGRWRLERWCLGTPCFLTPNQRHPITLRRIRRG